MVQGTIANVLDYYFGNPRVFGNELDRASKEFFGKEKPTAHGEAEDAQFLELFTQWFLFHFRFSSGKSVLEDFRERNPYGAAPEALEAYRTLADNIFGYFEVREVRRDEGMTLEYLHEKKTYWVKEKLATHELTPGDVFVGRIGKVGDVYELQGNPDLLPVHLDQKMKKVLAKDETDPRTYFRQLFTAKDGATASPFYNSTDWFAERPDALEKTLRESLIKCGIAPFVTLERIALWWKKEKDVTVIPCLLTGLIADDAGADDVSALFEALTAYVNLCPQKSGGEKTAHATYHQMTGQEQKGKAEIVFFGDNKWQKPYRNGLLVMRNGEYKKAIVEYEKAFTALLDDRTTTAQVYRFYANMAVAHFHIGDMRSGERYIEMALALHPKYEFALMMKERYERGEFDPLIGALFGMVHEMTRKGKKEMRERRETSAASRYFAFIKRFGIDFSAGPAKGDLTINAGTGKERVRAPLGRNDQCLCGKMKVDGRPIKYKHCHGK